MLVWLLGRRTSTSVDSVVGAYWEVEEIVEIHGAWRNNAAINEVRDIARDICKVLKTIASWNQVGSAIVTT